MTGRNYDIKGRETGFTAGLSLNQLTDKFYENLLSRAKVQNIFVPCKFFLKKACRRRLRVRDKCTKTTRN
jgi:hypothetical protein